MNHFQHFIFTRFNLGLYSAGNPYADKVGDPDQWMKHRLHLFKAYCLPSVKAQTCKEFIWIIAIDENTPLRFLDIDWSDLNVLFINEQPHEWLRRQQPYCHWLITSRFDNDDQYYPEFVEKIQANFRFQTELIDVDYRVVDIATGHKYASMRPRNNSPFISLIEPWGENPMTAMGRPHTVMCELYPSKKLHILAEQIIHDRNISNKIPR